MSTSVAGQLHLRLAEELRRAGLEDFELLLVLGSGLGAFAERLKDAHSVPFEQLDAMPNSSVPGHAGRFWLGSVAGRRVLVQQGRVHLYEGRSPEEVTRSVRAARVLGARGLVLTNAAGGLRRELVPGSLMRLTDHINLQGKSALFPEERAFGSPYDTEWGAAFEQAARELGFTLHSGVYAALLGPSYESHAEIRMLSAFGADAVGMSTVVEAAAGKAAGLRVAALSCITNLAAGLGEGPLSHAEVLEVGRQSAARFQALLERTLPRL